MRFTSVVLLALAGFSAAQTSTPSETSTTTSHSTSRTRSVSGTGTGTLSGTITASVNASSTLTTSSPIPTTTTYPTLENASTCVVNCLQVSISQTNCSAITQVDCYCTSERYRASLVQCVASNCPSELSSAEQLSQKFCDIVSVSLTFPAAPTSTTPAGSSGSGTTSPTSSVNAASTREHGFWALAALVLGIAAL
ncbi:hypothetical protein CTheo_3767 [Ceratobasidium theobromae]|uniref:CFEM domain-containing protein n=1 Tax=Ceratobasidium theobromae TaxID=1582974 RepID=A0A5N5QMJ1_9AGAM|nr:hypothetical protein CTheo_3767 [Ceratobasidium theobromae]